jgi:phage RecT family recombinase
MNDLVTFKKSVMKGGVFGREFGRSKAKDDLDWKVELAYAMEQVQRNEQLQACTPDSIGRSIVDAGVLGLTLSPAMKLAYLIPYKDYKTKHSYCTLSPSYMGLEQIAYRTGFVEMIQTNLVHEKDRFEVWTDEDGRHIRHEEAAGDRGGVSHAYCIAWFSSGRKHIEVMDKQQLIACRDAAAKKNGGKIPFTWTGGFRGEMYKKAVLRRAWKHWPRSEGLSSVAIEVVDRADPMEFSAGVTIDATDKISQDDIDSLLEIMSDGGVPQENQDAWLAGMARKLGYKTVRSIKQADFDEACQMMRDGLERWQQQHSTASAAGSS